MGAAVERQDSVETVSHRSGAAPVDTALSATGAVREGGTWSFKNFKGTVGATTWREIFFP
jgi:hypothetical protein